MLKMRYIVLIGFLFSAVGNLYSQEYTFFEKELVFKDNFENNDNSWRIFYGKIKKGRYDVETIGKDSPAISTIPIDFDQERDHEIEVTVSMEWNKSEDYMGLVWNRDLNNGYYLGFNKNLLTKLYYKEDGRIATFSEMRKSNIFYPMYQKNIFTVRKIGNEYSIFVNRLFIDTMTYEEAHGNHIGFFVGKSSELRVYNITVSYID